MTIAYINAVGQSGLTRTKQTQIESFLLREKIDILNIQEIDIDSNSFSHCPEISSSYNILSNNALSKYGTAVLLVSDLSPTNIQNDSSGRIILFEIENTTFGNVYLPSGTDSITRSAREEYISNVLPQMLLNRNDTGVVGGDFNCIIDKEDSLKYPEQKMTSSLKQLVNVFDLNDS